MDNLSLIGYSFLNSVLVFILSHVIVDKQFPEKQKVGAVAVISIVFVLFLLFGVIF